MFRVKAVHDVIKETADVSCGLKDYCTSITAKSGTEQFLSPEDHALVMGKLKILLTSVCDYCNERLAVLVSTQSDKTAITAQQVSVAFFKSGQMLIICYFQVADLAKIVEEFTSLCEKICGKQSANLKAAFKIQAGNYVQKFHHQRKSKLAMLLDAER